MHPLLPQEKKVLECIWSKQEPCVISDILKSDPSFNRNTVSKALVALEKKGYIVIDSIRKTATRTGRAYKAVVSPEEYEQQQQLIQSLSNGNTATTTALSFVSALLGSSSNEVSEKFIEELEDMIQKFKNKDE